MGKLSKKDLDEIYFTLREKFFAIDGHERCGCKGCFYYATDVHHKKGRIGYADKWAEDNNITLYIDTRFWMPICRMHHIKTERDPQWALRLGYSLPKTTQND